MLNIVPLCSINMFYCSWPHSAVFITNINCFTRYAVSSVIMHYLISYLVQLSLPTITDGHAFDVEVWRRSIMCDSAAAQWLVNSCVDSHLTFDWLKWHYYHVCMANGFPWAEGEHAFGVSARGENTHEPDSGPTFAPKSILTPLKRLSASMALQCNYPVGNDISTQFLPASLLPGSGQLPQARWKLCGDHAGFITVVIWSLQGKEMEKLSATLVREQLLSDLRLCWAGPSVGSNAM